MIHDYIIISTVKYSHFRLQFCKQPSTMLLVCIRLFGNYLFWYNCSLADASELPSSWLIQHTRKLLIINNPNTLVSAHSRTQSPSYVWSMESDEGLWPNPYQTGIWLATTKVIVLIPDIFFYHVLMVSGFGFGQAPRRTACKKGSGYKNGVR